MYIILATFFAPDSHICATSHTCNPQLQGALIIIFIIDISLRIFRKPISISNTGCIRNTQLL